MSDKIASKVGNGRRVSFWNDKWYGNKALCVSFSSLFALAFPKKAQVVDECDSMIEDGGWNPMSFRSFNDWELDMVERFL